MFERFIFVKRVIQAMEVIHCAVLIVNNSDEGDDFIAVIAESKKKRKNEVTWKIWCLLKKREDL